MRGRRLLSGAAMLAALLLGAAPAAGQVPSNRIVGGALAPPGTFGFTGVVVLGGGPPQADRRRELCTATLVEPTVAITAAHCFLSPDVYEPLPFVSPDKLSMVFGKRALASPEPGQRAAISSVFLPVGFQPAAPLSPSDYAVVHLSRAIAAPTAPLLPQNLEAGSLYGKVGSFAGWGVRRPFAGASANALRQGSGTIVPTGGCAGPPFLKRSSAFLCLAGRSLGAVCHGDSGGPLVVGGPYLVGVTNYTLQNCSRRGATEGFASLAPSGPNHATASIAIDNVDTTPPQLTVTQPLRSPVPRGKGRFPFTFHANEPVRAVCVRGRRAVPCARGFDGAVTIRPGKKPGPGTIRVIAFDQSFNRAQFDYGFTVG